MTISMNLLFLLVLLVGGVFLQIFLSKRESNYLGLILPGIAFLLSLLPIFNAAVPPGGTAADVIGPLAAAILLGNIPTAVLLVIYLACREKVKKRRQLDKMNIQDME